jgi:hypothetical protein
MCAIGYGGLHWFGFEVRDMDIEMERRRDDAEVERQQHELTRQAAERERAEAEKSRVFAEDGRRAVAAEVRATVETLTTVLSRMEALEALRREARRDTK